jgi:heme/copper-type cytochrome/quinol oxidase subunit 2
VSRNQRVGLVVVAVAVVVAAFVIARSGGDNSKTTSSTTGAKSGASRGKQAGAAVERIRIAGGKAVAGIHQITVEKGDRVRIAVSSRDTKSEVHVHGYNILKDMAPGKPVTFSFPATIEGVFEVELEGAHQQIAKLVVEPS